MTDEKKSLTPEEIEWRRDKSELLTRQNIHLHWAQALIWASFWMGMFGYLTWG